MACYATTVDENKYAKKILVTMLSEKIASNPERVAALAPASLASLGSPTLNLAILY